MESSEEDAGVATNTSRRPTAREKDIGTRENGSKMEKAVGSASGTETNSGSEEVFDNESVPSPSALDVNTSTEALLDMIDEIVEGPDAPKRMSLPSANSEFDDTYPTTSDAVRDCLNPTTPPPEAEPPPPPPPSLPSLPSQEPIAESNTDDANLSEPSISNVDRPEQDAVASTSAVNSEARESPKPQEIVVPRGNEVLGDPPTNIPSSSVTVAGESVSDVSESVDCARTVKSAISSDSRDKVTVETAESTSSDNSVSESSLGQSPLRRRLVRPALAPLPPPQSSDRRPDCTVSSTADSNTLNVHTTEQTVSECVVKDVTSSSDAVPSVHGNVEPEEIRNVSEVSVCKAETSVSPPKKIKLIRQKPPPTLTSKVVPERATVTTDSDQCQSTSFESQAVLSTPEMTKSSDSMSRIPSQEVVAEPLVQKDDQNVPEPQPEPSPQVETSEIAENQLSKESLNKTNETPEVTEPVVSHSSPNEQKTIAPATSNEIPSDTSESLPSESKIDNSEPTIVECSSSDVQQNLSDAKQVPKLTIKLSGKHNAEEIKSPSPKVTIKPVKPPEAEVSVSSNEQISNLTKLHIKPIPKPAEKINDVHRKSSSSEISESESSENDESNSTSDQTSASEQGSSDVVPKVTIKLGKPGTKCEGKFYTEPNIPKLTIKGLQNMENEEQDSSKLTLVYSQTEDKQQEKVPKLTIKAVSKGEGQPLSPKLTIKPLKPPETLSKESMDADSQTIPKITIKPVKMDSETSKTPKKLANTSESENDIPVIAKLNIKPIVKPVETTVSIDLSEEKVPVVSKLNIKPIIKPVESEASETMDPNLPIISKINIKPIIKPVDKSPSLCYSEDSVPVVSKLNIKPVLKPADSLDTLHDSEVKLPVVSKLNIKPIVKPADAGESVRSDDKIPIVSKLNIKPVLKPTSNDDDPKELEAKVPVVSKLNIKPILKPKDNELDSSKEEILKVTKLNIKPLKNPAEEPSCEKDCDELNAVNEQNSIPIVTKLNIKPIVKSVDENAVKESENQSSETGNSSDDNENIPFVTKLNIKPIVKPTESEALTPEENIPVITKLNIKPLVKPEETTKSPQSPKREGLRSSDSKPIVKHNESEKSTNTTESNIPVVTKLNIKPLVKPEETTKSPKSPKREGLRSSDLKNQSVPAVTKLNIKPILKPDESEQPKNLNENDDSALKNPPLVMKINMKAMTESSSNESDSKSDMNIHKSQEVKCNNVSDSSISKSECQPLYVNTSDKVIVNCKSSSSSPRQVMPKQNCSIDKKESSKSPKAVSPRVERLKIKPICDLQSKEQPQNQTKLENIYSGTSKAIEQIKFYCTSSTVNATESITTSVSISPRPSTQNCTLLKKLLETKKDGLDTRLEEEKINTNHIATANESTDVVIKDLENSEQSDKKVVHSESNIGDSLEQNKINDLSKQQIDSLTKPLEVIVPEKVVNQSSGQDSPRIILKINKTDQGASAKLITEDVKRPDSPKTNDTSENTQENKEKLPQKKNALNSRKKTVIESPNVTVGKRLRSSRVVEENTPAPKKNACKRSPTAEISPPQNKETELSNLESKRLKLGQLLSNKSLTITPIPSKTQISPPKTNEEPNQKSKITNHAIINNENCSKNGSSKLQAILSNLQAKQVQALAFNDAEKKIVPDLESNASTGSSDVVEVMPLETSLISRDSGVSRDLSVSGEEARDPLDTSRDSPAPQPTVTISPQPTVTISPQPTATISPQPTVTISPQPTVTISPQSTVTISLQPTVTKSPQPTVTISPAPTEAITPQPAVPSTPQPKKRGRPRKLPVSEGAKPPAPVVLPTPALEERPQRSLRLNRERPAIQVKPRGRGRGRGARRDSGTPRPTDTPTPQPDPETPVSTSQASDEDPTSSRIKLPRLTEALDRMPASLVDTPVSHRRRSSTPLRLLSEGPELKVVLENTPINQEASGRGGRPLRGRGSRGGKMYTPRNRGRGRGGGRGAVYMKETMGIYGRVCGPATTTVQLFEEETCMMDDNATPAKPSNLIDEDSQSSVKSLTNEPTVKKSKLDDLFDSSREWTAADVKEYIWPPPDKQQENEPPVTYMIQEQIALFLGARSFGRRYPELKGRSVEGEERDYILGKGIVDQALCEAGITAVDASNVLDIMLSDFPHKYEEFRCHQRSRQLAEAENEAAMETEEVETGEKAEPKEEPKSEVKVEPKVEAKPEPSKADLEKTRLELAKAAIASASEFNARLNASRRVGSADLQSMTVHVRRAPLPAPPAPRARPAAGFYPHALLPGQYQQEYTVYSPEQLRCFPLNTVVCGPPVPPSPPLSDQEDDEDSTSSDDSLPPVHPAKRKKLTKTKRSSQNDTTIKEENACSNSGSMEASQPVELCRVCNLRQEGNRKHSHERFLSCATCNAKLHPNCVTLGADTIRRARQYAWQCELCKVCSSCNIKPEPGVALVCCDLCDRGFHATCLGLTENPPGRWHCAECAICKSCGARSPAGPPSAALPAPAPQWTHHTKRGPGGHKVYSHSLCTPCASNAEAGRKVDLKNRAHRIGRYCPLCDRSIIAPKGSMQLIICKLCDRQHHQECVRGSTTSVVKVLDWTCAECRRGGITSRSAAARAAPRTIATLFMAKRRFNKYAHRQYLQTRRPRAPPAPVDASDSSTLDPLNDSLAEAPEIIDASDSILDPSDSIVDASDSLMEPTDPLHDVSESDQVEASESDPLVDPLVEAAAEADAESNEPLEDPLQGAEDEAAAAVAALAMDMA